MSLGQSQRHDSSHTHVSGESVFIDDRLFLRKEVLVDVVGSPVNHGKIKKIDFTEAMKVDGVLAVYTGADFVHNLWGTIVAEQPILASEIASYRDEPICIVAAETREALALAKTKIKIDFEERTSVTDLAEAIRNRRFLYSSTPLKKGQAEEAYEEAPHQLQGEFECGGQEHFYLESQASIAYPTEDGQIEIHSSSQHPSETQHVCAHALGLHLHEVICVVKRMGGGFGGKESQAAPFAAMAALVAKKLNRPARMVITKDQDMQMTGKRHPFKIFYKVGFDDQGKILSLIAQIYSDAGAYVDLSPSILDRALFHIDGCYHLPNALIEGHACRTHRHSNTAFRGFGGPQGNMAMESLIEDIAVYLKKDSLSIRQLNVYHKGEKTPYGQEIEDEILVDLYQQIEKEADYVKRKKQIQEYNQKMQGKLRGISVTGVKFGIAFTARFLNQGNALVNIYRDGTVQVSTGATEMGQGVNTKIQQTVAQAFAIGTEKIKVMATSTEKNHNTSPTAASSGADINCAAALKACKKILLRMKWVAYLQMSGQAWDDVKEYASQPEASFDPQTVEVKEEHFWFQKQKLPWLEVIRICYLNRMSLGDYAHFRTQGLGFDKKTGKGRPFNYFTNGVACSEVEIDEYTGELKVLRVDLLMDLGRPMNPGIDRGQVIGAFIQGMGWVTTEKLHYHENGKLLSHSPTTYKIPNIQDTPRIFNVRLLTHEKNQQNIFKTKAVGEPPLLLATSVWTAVKQALSYRSKGKVVDIKSPATNEEILMKLVHYDSL